jgi:hypothetical protein
MPDKQSPELDSPSLERPPQCSAPGGILETSDLARNQVTRERLEKE